MKENLSQRKLLEVLTHEIEVLRKTSTNINEVAPLIAEQIKNLKETKVEAKVDLGEMKMALSGHKSYLDKKVTNPKWLIILLVFETGVLIIQSMWLYHMVFSN